MTTATPSSPDTAGHQAVQTTGAPQTGTPLTLADALLRIAELEQEINRNEVLAVENRRRGTAEQIAERFCLGLREHVANAVEVTLAALADQLPLRPDAVTEAAGEYLPAAEQFASDTGYEFLDDLAGFLADLEEKVTKEAPAWEQQMAADEAESAEVRARATADKGKEAA